MIKLLTLSLMALSLSATPFFPDFSRDRFNISGSPLIGAPINGPGRYLFALEDLLLTDPSNDFDYNDVYGELTYFGDNVGAYQIQVQGGLGNYFNSGTAGFAGARFVDGQFTLVFNTPTGEMFSGTNQVLIYKLADLPGSPVPEPSTWALGGAALLLLALLANHNKRSSI